ncbi:MAG: competence/damage-inducible protein A [Dehalococcoidia bacterium]
MRSEIVSIGTEILLGEITDTNAPYIASRLPILGIDLYWIHQVGDNQGRLAEVLERALSRSDLVLTTGGLGPTQDDVTREAIAQVMGEEMKLAPALERELRAIFEGRGYPMPETNLKQACLIPSSNPIPNPRGTAPGWWVERDGKTIIAMPGPPSEMHRMWTKEVEPRLREMATEGVISSRTIKTFGIGEGSVDEMVAPLLSSTNPTIGVYARIDGIHIRITSKAENEEEAGKLISDMERRVREIMGDSIWGIDEETLESNVGRLLLLKNLSLATMESCTGGLLASTITDVPGSSSYFRGGLVAYTNEMKVEYGVDPAVIDAHGAVSFQTAEAMAQLCRERLGADFGVSVTGVAGPDSSEGKPPGTMFVGIASSKDVRSFDPEVYGNRPLMKQRAAIAALFQLQRRLQE